MKNNKSKKGFTLIELIIVIAIIAIIAAVAVPKITVMMDAAKEAKFDQDLHSLRIATMTLAEEDPIFRTYTKGGSHNEEAAAAIAKALNLTSGKIGTYQLYTIYGIEVPTASKWYIVTNENGVYLRADHMDKDKAIEIAEKLGYGVPTVRGTEPMNLNAYYWDNGYGNIRHTLYALVRYN